MFFKHLLSHSKGIQINKAFELVLILQFHILHFEPNILVLIINLSEIKVPYKIEIILIHLNRFRLS